ncbi:hypothetical protein D3C80_832990 [compost metagenome]
MHTQQQPGIDHHADAAAHLRTDNADFRTLALAHQFAQPLGIEHQAARVDEQQIAASRLLGGLVDQLLPGAVLGLDNAQLIAAQLPHRSKPGLQVLRLVTLDGDQYFIVAVSGVFENRFNTAPKRLQVLPGHDNDRYRGRISVLVQHPGQHAVLRRYQFGLDTQALQVRLQYAGCLGHAGRLRLPAGIVVLTLHQQFGDVFDHLQAMAFNHPPEQVLRRQYIIVSRKAAQLQQPGTLKGEHAPDIGKTAHQVEVEVGLEDRLANLQVIVTAFIGVQAQSVGVQGQALGHDHQGVGMQAITGAQEQHPVCRVGPGDPRIELVKTVAAQGDVLDTGFAPRLLPSAKHPDLMRRIGLGSQAVECRLQGHCLALRIEHHSNDARLSWPLFNTLGQQADLRGRQGATLKPLGVELGKAQAPGADLLLIVAHLPGVQAGQLIFVPLQRLAWLEILKRHVANPAGSRRRFTGIGGEHLKQPFALGLVCQGHAGLMAQTAGVNPLDTEHVGQIDQVPAPQQAHVQRHIQACNEPGALLHQRRQVLFHRGPAHEHMTDAAKQVGNLAADRIKHIATIEDRAAGGD